MSDTPVFEHPTPQHIVQTYRAVLRRIVEALRKGTEHARWYFDYMDEGIDNGLAPALVRKGAKRHLLQTSTGPVVTVNNEEDAATPSGATTVTVPNDGHPEFLSNLGLAISAEGIRIRVLRSDNGDVPVPGPSKARQAFYRQQIYLAGVEWVPEGIPSDVTHLVLHWETDEEYNLDRVHLALPLGGDTTRDSVSLMWNEIIWRSRRYVGGTQVEAETHDQDIYISGEETGN